MNELDRAIVAAIRSHAAMPDLLRQLLEGELWFLMPYQPDLEGEVIELKNGMPLPFVQLQDERGPVVPLFSSEERVDEGLAKGKVPPRTFSAGAMPAQQAFAILGGAKLHAVLNKSCGTGEILLSPELLRDLANGTALRVPSTDGGPQGCEQTVQLIDPADYPTDLVQRMFEFVRQHREFRAAWIFESPEGAPLPQGGRRYQVLVLMDPRDDAIFHDFRLVAGIAPQTQDEINLGLLDETDAPYLAALFQRVSPFYLAADYGCVAGGE
jgi:SseB protein C-terminal domain/SseB protein N-terminal domain